MDLRRPLPACTFTDGPGVGGQIKVRPEDFIVEEIPLYEPAGTGEHLYLRIQKIGVSHGELVSRLQRHFDVRHAAIGYAGMKDKHAVTSQTISIHRHDDPPSVDLGDDRIRVVWATRHKNKLRRGHLVGNRFSIRIRDADPIAIVRACETLRVLERIGVPTYFGSQRFGYRVNNQILGAHLLRRDYDKAIDELLGTGSTPFPDHQEERRQLYESGAFEDASALWSTADRSELIAAKTLARGGNARDATLAIGAPTLNFWTSALSSAAFNWVLDERVTEGTVGTLRVGDLAWKHDSRAVFPVTPENDDLTMRLERGEISPSGPLWGATMTTASGETAEREARALAATGVTVDDFKASRFRPEGRRRPLRERITNIETEGGFDEHGPYLLLAFDLPRGMYATEVLREVMKG